MRWSIALLAVFAWGSAALAQEATNTPAATQPAQGSLYLRQKFQYIALGDDPSPEDRDVDKFISTTSLSYGLERNVSLTLDIPLAYAIEETSAGTERYLGFNDIALGVKYRPVQIDLNPIDSVRFAVFGGIEIPSGFDDDLSSHSWDPFIGGIFTAILGRHGINQSVSYKFNYGGDEFSTRAGDGPSNALRYDTAYLFRLSPAEYTPETSAATYLTLELNGLYETNGDNEIMFGPGILYEARTFAVEASVGVPILSDVEERPETDLVVTLGFRILF
jgi:hypothetical protein